jgi:hypothetical protein
MGIDMNSAVSKTPTLRIKTRVAPSLLGARVVLRASQKISHVRGFYRCEFACAGCTLNKGWTGTDECQAGYDSHLDR